MKTKVITDLPRATQEAYVRAVYGKWTTTPPTEPGLYKTVDKSGGVFWVLVGKESYTERLFVVHFGNQNDYDLSEYTQWCGPIPEPEPPQVDA